MLCNHCGKEFGEGITCQFCGTDRVEALGTFGGFHPNSKGSGSLKQGITTPGGISVTNSDKMLCFCCGEIIPGVAKFCPYCKAEQYVVCPKCGIRYLAQYPSCYECGTEREKYLREQEVERKKRAEEAALREAMRPIISSFKVSKYRKSGDYGIVLKWSCINVEFCDLSWSIDSNWILFRNNLGPIGTVNISANSIAGWWPIYKSPTRVNFRLKAKGKYGDLIQETLWIGVQEHWFSPLEIFI